VRHLCHTVAWIAVPSVLLVAFALIVTDDYTGTNLLLANKFLGPSDSITAGRLRFVEVFVWILVALAVLYWLTISDRLDREASCRIGGGRCAAHSAADDGAQTNSRSAGSDRQPCDGSRSAMSPS
jgi:hypothetical protein